MTHDPLCPTIETGFDTRCQCDLIAKVREDEQDNAWSSVAEMPALELWDGVKTAWWIVKADALTAIAATLVDAQENEYFDEWRHQLEHSDEVLSFVHHEDSCIAQYCTIHRMSDHSMRSFPQHWREDAGFMERICPHGIGHPDPDEYALTQYPALRSHGCDGCCA